jgi:hypothetical protein
MTPKFVTAYGMPCLFGTVSTATQYLKLAASLLNLLPFNDVSSADYLNRVEPPKACALRDMSDWTRSFLMRDHAELGRSGNVCPFTSMGARMDTLRFGVSDATPIETSRIRGELIEIFSQFERIPHPRKMGIYRAIMIGFPNCSGAEGVAALSKVQKSLRFFSFRRARMIGLFHPQADAPGLWNPRFRPLRAPLPMIALRSLVVQDAAFVMRHPLLAPAYLANFPLAGTRQLAERMLQRS